MTVFVLPGILITDHEEGLSCLYNTMYLLSGCTQVDNIVHIHLSIVYFYSR